MNNQWQDFLQQSELYESDTVESALLDNNSNNLFDLSHLSLISISGNDALTFLNGQFISEVKNITPSGTQISAWCNPKGQVLCVFILLHIDDEFHIILPNNMKESFLSRLRMYVLRSDVVISDVTNEFILLGANNINSMTTLLECEDKISCMPGDVVSITDLTIINITDHSSRILLIGRLEKFKSLLINNPQSIKVLSPLLWQILDIQSGMPWLSSETGELYLPQMLNLDLLGALSLSKGCYPGQEVVARLHYRGKVKRRLMLASVMAEAHIGDTLHYSNTEHSVGAVLSCICDCNGLSHLLIVIETDVIDNRNIRLSNNHGPALTITLPPYAINE